MVHLADQELEDTCPFSFDTAWAIVQFISLNILVHVLTIPRLAGETWTETAFRCFQALLRPTMAALPLLQSLAAYLDRVKRRIKIQNQNINAGPIPAFMLLMLRILAYMCEAVLQRITTGWRQIFYGIREDSYPMQDAVHAGAVALLDRHSDFPDSMLRTEWTALGESTRKMLWYDGRIVEQCDRRRARLVPLHAEILEGSKGIIQVPSESSSIEIAIAIGQLCYSSAELYLKDAQGLRQKGLSSPYIVVIPYIVGSFLNLLCNFFIGTYPHIVILPYNCKSPRIVDGRLKSIESWIPVPEVPQDRDSQVEKSAVQDEPPEFNVVSKKLKFDNRIFHFNLYWAHIACSLAGPAFVTCILLPATRLRVTDTITTVSFLFWIYGDLFFFVPLIACGLTGSLRRKVLKAMLADTQFVSAGEVDQERSVGNSGIMGMAGDIKPGTSIWAVVTFSYLISFAFFVWGMRTAWVALWQIDSAC